MKQGRLASPLFHDMGAGGSIVIAVLSMSAVVSVAAMLVVVVVAAIVVVIVERAERFTDAPCHECAERRVGGKRGRVNQRAVGVGEPRCQRNSDGDVALRVGGIADG